jgi:hypothetical protein
VLSVYIALQGSVESLVDKIMEMYPRDVDFKIDALRGNHSTFFASEGSYVTDFPTKARAHRSAPDL